MCTITFIPHNDKAFITHSRDESALRASAVAPAKYQVNGSTLLYPKDQTGGGTWIAVNENGNTGVLMNGGFVKHAHTPPYRKSRGLILPEIVSDEDMHAAYNAIDLQGIEPFTVILYNNNTLLECRWTGQQKFVTPYDAGEWHIWSSATLYDDAAIAKRKQWFNAWQQQHPVPEQHNIIDFHLYSGAGDLYNGIRMNRNNTLLTVSLTSLAITDAGSSITYTDLRNGITSAEAIPFILDPAETQ